MMALPHHMDMMQGIGGSVVTAMEETYLTIKARRVRSLAATRFKGAHVIFHFKTEVDSEVK